jgi:hypothetical protein
MNDHKSRVGEKSGVRVEECSAERVHRFARSIGAPVGDEAPPTFLTVMRRSEFDLFDQLGIPLQSILHAEQEYTYVEPIRVGDTVRCQSELAKVLEKSGASGSMAFMTFRTEFIVRERPVATSSTVIVVRHQHAQVQSVAGGSA